MPLITLTLEDLDFIQISHYGKLYISRDYEDWSAIRDLDISVLIDLDGGLDKGVPSLPNHIIYLYFPILDGDLPNLIKLHAVARIAADLCRQGYGVLTHCLLGLNRSAMLTGVILTYLGLTGREACALLREKRPGSLFNPVFAAYLESLPAQDSITEALVI
jgi:protein-tyrosine phosphatase